MKEKSIHILVTLEEIEHWTYSAILMVTHSPPSLATWVEPQLEIKTLNLENNAKSENIQIMTYLASKRRNYLMNNPL